MYPRKGTKSKRKVVRINLNNVGSNQNRFFNYEDFKKEMKK